ncbi:hypothetical protein Pmani_031415 [Petrolisthes manimaculis]|uniref:Ig-like domain-containing protein n=1 Tax=Petrolisthes manimaculis TaxID=1843537 RepID=A0AAE1NVY6_9EUCA|nr:hypothetical protein Pmani_031415 [Petrolisthes manimaculis]
MKSRIASTTALMVTLVVCLTPPAASLPTRLKMTTTTTMREETTPSTKAEGVIMNGTMVRIGFSEEAWVYCRAQVPTDHHLHHYQVKWVTATGKMVSPWSRHNAGPQVYTLGGGPHIPHSYLVFDPFVPSHASHYSCILVFNGTPVHQSTIRVDQS